MRPTPFVAFCLLMPLSVLAQDAESDSARPDPKSPQAVSLRDPFALRLDAVPPENAPRLHLNLRKDEFRRRYGPQAVEPAGGAASASPMPASAPVVAADKGSVLTLAQPGLPEQAKQVLPTSPTAATPTVAPIVPPPGLAVRTMSDAAKAAQAADAAAQPSLAEAPAAARPSALVNPPVPADEKPASAGDRAVRWVSMNTRNALVAGGAGVVLLVLLGLKVVRGRRESDDDEQ